MRYLIFCLALLLSWSLSAQRHDTKNIDGVDYLIKTDTSASGVITIQKIPSLVLLDDLNSQLGSVAGRIEQIDQQADALQAERKGLVEERKELQALIKKISPVAPKNTQTPKPPAKKPVKKTTPAGRQ